MKKALFSSFSVYMAAFALTACNGNTSGPFMQVSGIGATSGESATCTIPNYYHFGGACTSGPLAPGGSTYKLADYRGVKAVFKIPANNGGGHFTFTYADATGAGDIGRLHRRKFPLYPNPCGGSSCPGTAFFYVGVGLAGPSHNLTTYGNNVFSFVNNNPYPGKSCGEAILTNGEWNTFGPINAPRRTKLTFAYAVNYVTGVYTVAIYCM